MVSRHWPLLAWLLSLVILLAMIPSFADSSSHASFSSTTYLPLVIKAGPTAAPSVSILSNHSYFVDAINYLKIVGEVENSTSDTVQSVKVIADFYNGNGQMIANTYTYTYLFNLPSNTRTCFHISFPQPNNWTSFQFEAPIYWTPGRPPPNLTVVSPISSIDSTFGYSSYRIVGMVRNDHGSRVESVELVGTLYDATGKVYDCMFTYANTSDLNPGQSTSFTLRFFSRSSYADAASYRLQTEGRAQ